MEKNSEALQTALERINISDYIPETSTASSSDDLEEDLVIT